MNRRGFFGGLLGAAVARLAAKFIPKTSLTPAVETSYLIPSTAEVGISIRMIRSFDADGNAVCRMDVLHPNALLLEDHDPTDDFLDQYCASPARSGVSGRSRKSTRRRQQKAAMHAARLPA